jgi:hypothetical protein
LVCARLGQVGSQVNAHATKLGKVIALVGISTSVVLQLVFRRVLFLLTLEIRSGLSGLQVGFLLSFDSFTEPIVPR